MCFTYTNVFPIGIFPIHSIHLNIESAARHNVHKYVLYISRKTSQLQEEM